MSLSAVQLPDTEATRSASPSEGVPWRNPFLEDADPSDAIVDQLAPEGGARVLPSTYEATVEQLLEADPNAAGYMRGPVRALFLQYPRGQWEAARAACPALLLHEFRAIRLYTENYFREINRGLRQRFPLPPPAGPEEALPHLAPDVGHSSHASRDDATWRFTRLYWWIHNGVRKLAGVQSRLDRVFRWHKKDRWEHWSIGSIYTSRTFTSTAGSNPRVDQYQYGKYFGCVLLIFDLAEMPQAFIADISLCSKFESEGEALMLPWLSFRVMDVTELSADEQRQWQATCSVTLKYWPA